MKELNITKLCTKHKKVLLTILSGIFGAVVFIWIYGIEVLDVTRCDWLFEMDDLTQHYIGWVFYRKADWVFPIGLFNTLSFPNYASIIYTDSIPLFAIIFKFFSGLLPENFQYFGLYGILCYILQGVFAFILLKKYIKNDFYCIIGTLFFIFSPYMLQRMFWHNALSSHCLILASLCLLAYRNIYKNNKIKKIILWNLLLVCSLTIHLYYVPIIFIVMVCSFIAEYIEDNDTGISSALSFAISIILVVALVLLLGGTTSKSLACEGIDYYNINLNTFFNPQGSSSFFKDLPIATLRRI